MPHLRTPRRKPTTAVPLIALAATLVAATLGLAACGGSTTTTTQTSANAAATGVTTPGTTTPGATTPGTTTPSTTPSGTPPTGGPGVPPGGRPNPARFTAMRACLAKKGITLPQRTPGVPGLSGGGAQQLPKGMTRAQFAEALKSCGGTGFAGGRFGSGGPRGGGRSFDSPRFHQTLEDFATCLRKNGVNVGEPNTSGKGPIFDTKGINTGSPQFRAASTKCRTALFASMPHRASPGAAGGATG